MRESRWNRHDRNRLKWARIRLFRLIDKVWYRQTFDGMLMEHYEGMVRRMLAAQAFMTRFLYGRRR